MEEEVRKCCGIGRWSVNKIMGRYLENTVEEGESSIFVEETSQIEIKTQTDVVSRGSLWGGGGGIDIFVDEIFANERYKHRLGQFTQTDDVYRRNLWGEGSRLILVEEMSQIEIKIHMIQAKLNHTDRGGGGGGWRRETGGCSFSCPGSPTRGKEAWRGL